MITTKHLHRLRMQGIISSTLWKGVWRIVPIVAHEKVKRRHYINRLYKGKNL